MPKAILSCFSKSSLHLLLLFNESDCYLSHVKLSGFKKLQHCRNHISYISIVELSVGLLKVYSVLLSVHLWITIKCFTKVMSWFWRVKYMFGTQDSVVFENLTIWKCHTGFLETQSLTETVKMTFCISISIYMSDRYHFLVELYSALQ